MCLLAAVINYEDPLCFTKCTTQLERSDCEAGAAALSLDLITLSSLVFSLSDRVSFLALFVTSTVVSPLRVLSFLLFQAPLEKPSG